MRFYSGVCAVLLFLTVSQVKAQAIDFDNLLSTVADTLTDISDTVLSDISNVRIGIGPVISPDYDGSKDYQISIRPLLTFRYRDLLQLDNNRLRFYVVGSDAIYPSERFKAGPLIKIGSSRSEDDNSNLHGLGNVGTSIELGGFASYEVGPAQFRIRLQQDIGGGHSGMLLSGDIQTGIYQGEHLTVIGSISLSWADDKYMGSYYSINENQSQAAGLPVFNAGSGLKDIRGGFGANYNLSDYWSVLGFAGYARFLGDAGNSPLIKLRGSPNQFAAGVFLAFRF